MRRWIGRALHAIAQDQLDDVLLVADELLENAYKHNSGPQTVRSAHFPSPTRSLDLAAPVSIFLGAMAEAIVSTAALGIGGVLQPAAPHPHQSRDAETGSRTEPVVAARSRP